MKYLWMVLLLVGPIQAGEPDQRKESYESYWTNVMRGTGVNPDTIKMFIEAPDAAVTDSMGILKINPVSRYVSAEGDRGYLLFIRFTKKIEAYEIEAVKVFDLALAEKK